MSGRVRKTEKRIRKPLYSIKDGLIQLQNVANELKDKKMIEYTNNVYSNIEKLKDHLDRFYNWD